MRNTGDPQQRLEPPDRSLPSVSVTGTVPPTSPCAPGKAGGGACIRGTVGCPHTHDEVTLLERLDSLERQLIEAMALPTYPPIIYPHQDAVAVTAEWKMARVATINSASARCMAAAARCLVSAEEMP